MNRQILSHNRAKASLVATILFAIVATCLPAQVASASGGVSGGGSTPVGIGTDVYGGPTHAGGVCNQPGLASPFVPCVTNHNDGIAQVLTKGLCPTGWDVWRFYGSSADPSKVISYTTSRITITNYNNCKSTVAQGSAYASIPNPADATGTMPSKSPGINSLAMYAGLEYPCSTGCSASNPYVSTLPSSINHAVYRVNNNIDPATGKPYPSGTTGGTYTTYDTFQHSGSCSSLQVNNVAQVRDIFTTLANGGSTTTQLSPAILQWAANYWSGLDPASPGFTWWLTSPQSPARGNVNYADYMMNLNPSLTAADLGINPLSPPQYPTPKIWQQLASHFGSGLPTCSSSYQFLTIPKAGDPEPAEPIMGVCIIPIERAAQPFAITGLSKTQYTYVKNRAVGDYLSTYLATGANRYFPYTGKSITSNPKSTNLGQFTLDKFNSNASWEASAHIAWRNIIANEVSSRANAPMSAFGVGGPYLDGLPTAFPAAGTTNRTAAVAAASNQSLCVDAKDPVPTSKVTPPTTTTTPPTTTPTSPVNTSAQIWINPQILDAGGTVSGGVQTIPVHAKQIPCPACVATPRLVSYQLSSVTFGVRFHGTLNYGHVLTSNASHQWAEYFNADSAQAPFADSGGYSILETHTYTSLPQTIDYHFVFYTATSPAQRFVISIEDPVAKFLVKYQVQTGTRCIAYAAAPKKTSTTTTKATTTTSVPVCIQSAPVYSTVSKTVTVTPTTSGPVSDIVAGATTTPAG